mmetsp:Transcript_32615/g.68905  ORF Transcript_32615/g.68905 Transcript_32615/m.68905 type:complete len:259 (+) Transcript_32615:316-1092(+)
MHVRRRLLQHLLLVLLLIPSRFLLPASRPHAPRLEVGAVRARDKFPVRVLAGEPRLQIVLFDGRVVERPGNDAHDAIGEAEALVKFLGGVNHAGLFSGRFLEVVHHDAELFDLFELVDAEDAADVPSGGSGLLAEAGGDAGVAEGKGLVVDPLVFVISADRLFRGGDEVFFRGSLRIVRLSRNFVKLLVEVLQLRNARHDVFVHHVGRLQDLISALAQEGNSVVDQGLIQEDAGVFEKVSAMSGHGLSSNGFVAPDAP